MSRSRDEHQDSSTSVYLRLQERFGSDLNPRISLTSVAEPSLGDSDAATRYAPVAELDEDEATITMHVWDLDLRRPLAMKILRDTGDANDPRLARFLEEAQITAQLDHPGIAPVHELGIDRDGNAFFTMSLVRGDTFTAVIERVRTGDGGDDWTLSRAIAILQRAAEAVAFAHARGVVHRRLDSDAIRVGRFGEAFVGEWGDAIATDAESSRIEPDPDICAIGRTLAALLDAKPSRAPAELIAIRDKALARQPERYPDVATLVRDLRAYREQRVVLAHATGAVAELRTWLRRNRPLAVASVVGAVVLVVGLIASIILASMERRASAHASDNAKLAFSAVDKLLSRIGESRLKNVPQMDPIRRELLQDALAMLEQLDAVGEGADRRPEIAAALHRIGAIQRQFGEHRAARKTFERGIAVLESFLAEFPGHRKASGLLLTAKSRVATCVAASGDDGAALEMERAALRWAEQIERNFDMSDDFRERKLRVLTGLAGQLQQAGETAEAIVLFEQALAARRDRVRRRASTTAQQNLASAIADLGWIHAKAGDLDEAGEHYRDALGEYEALIAAHPDEANYRYRAAHHINNYAAALMDAGRFDPVFELFADAMEKAQQLVEDYPDRLDYRIVLASATSNLGSAYRRTDRPEEAIPIMQRAGRVERAALSHAPDDAFLRRNILNGGVSLCDTMMRVGRWRDAADQMAELRELPVPGDLRMRLAECHLLARCVGRAEQAGDDALAEGYARRALAALEDAVDFGFDKPPILGHEGFDAIREYPEFAELEARVAEAARGRDK